MTREEYYNLKTGDVVYRVRLRFLKAEIERGEVEICYYIPGLPRTRFVSVNGSTLSDDAYGYIRQRCFLTLDEASDYLRKVLDERKTKPFKVGFHVYPNTAVMVREA